MSKNKKTFTLDLAEALRVKKIGNYYYAYARRTSYSDQTERYLGRCETDGSIYDHKIPYCRYRGGDL